MITPNEFWLSLHNLSEAYEAEGLTPDERIQNIMNQFRRMPPTVQRSLIVELHDLAQHTNDLFVAAHSIASEEAGRSDGAPTQGRAG